MMMMNMVLAVAAAVFLVHILFAKFEILNIILKFESYFRVIRIFFRVNSNPNPSSLLQQTAWNSTHDACRMIR